MRQEAQLQGLTDPKFVWTCQVQCYDNKTTQAGDVMANTKIVMNFLPFTETKANKTLAAFVKYVGKDKINGFAVWGWVSTLLFKQAAESVVKTQGVNGLTRANLLTALQGHAQLRCRRHVGQDGPGRQAQHGLLHDPELRRQQVRPGVPDQGGHLRLQAVEPPVDRRGPAQPVKPQPVRARPVVGLDR